uniref:ATP synthase c subunit lysine N-methyltransferase n=1 Tax=Xenopus tropicalis TaxID=8364 RepID=A0A803J5V2_XENTR
MSKSCNESKTLKEYSIVSSTNKPKKKKWGLIATGVMGGTLVALYAVATPFVAPALRKCCLPYVPATTAQVENVLKMIRTRSGLVVDIGSGDGRIALTESAIATSLGRAFHNLTALTVKKHLHCFKRNLRCSNLKGWPLVSFSQYPNVVIFGVPQMMPQLEKKLQMELQDAARVIACRFPFPNWVPDHTFGEGVDTIWTYDLDVNAFKKVSDSKPIAQQHCTLETAE